MSDKMDVPAREDGVVRLFAVDLDPMALEAFGRRNGSWPVADALGVEMLAPDQVELFAVSDLTGVGLTGYLEEGLGVAPAELAGMRPQLEAVKDGVLIVRSRAFGGAAVTLHPRAPLRHIATFHEERPPVQFEPLPSAGAAGVIGSTASSERPRAKHGWWPMALIVIGVIIIGLALAL
ncbi:hypothetical protein [Roseovarius pelagicus]|uniref:Aspartate carbamoyltransferase catalytic subunit n=1 Tax=Roseovarius pelagicus TaxID=2980108 RepID=A0ABY6D636_9RHOB|nr:hypothetical protein [Roseovarius pelagicus]UXX81612.1 hypothetical protein N7U68_10710 [Roseovarius pelagicus]